MKTYVIAFRGVYYHSHTSTKLGRIRSVRWADSTERARKFNTRLLAVAMQAWIHRDTKLEVRVINLNKLTPP